MTQALCIRPTSVQVACPLREAARNVFDGCGSAIEVAEALNCALTTRCIDRRRCREQVAQLVDFLCDCQGLARR